MDSSGKPESKTFLTNDDGAVSLRSSVRIGSPTPFPSQVWREQGGMESVKIMSAQFALSFFFSRLLLLHLCCPDWSTLRAAIAHSSFPPTPFLLLCSVINLCTVWQKQTTEARLPLLLPVQFLSELCCEGPQDGPSSRHLVSNQPAHYKSVILCGCMQHATLSPWLIKHQGKRRVVDLVFLLRESRSSSCFQSRSRLKWSRNTTACN